MSVGDVADRIISFVRSELGLHRPEEVTDQTPLLNGLIDSLQVMWIISFVEEQFDVSLDIAEVTAENFATIADIERLVAKLRAEGS
jgi:acyl carrier protein